LAYIQLGSSALANQEIMSVPLLERETPMIVFARARLAEASGDIAGAVTLLNKEDEQQREHFEAEFVPLLPAGEALGGLYLRAHRYPDAEAAFRETLSRYPQDPRALYGLARALQGEGKPFQQTDESFNAAWSGADTTLSINEL
jgi:tetratricopeptide (TPR) repeat protein